MTTPTFFAVASLQTIFGFFAKGGFFMVPLILCSVASLTVILLRAVALRRDKVMPPAIELEIERLSPGGNPDKILRMVGGDSSSLGRIVETALKHRRWPKAENMEAVQTRARHEMVRMESGLALLELIVGIGPLLGLLGTVSGLVGIFANLGVTSGDTQGIALGIAEALTTTITGLAVAIPSLIGFSYFSKKIETMSVEMESLIGDLIAKCYHEKASILERVETTPAPARRDAYRESSSFSPEPPSAEESFSAREPARRRFRTGESIPVAQQKTRPPSDRNEKIAPPGETDPELAVDSSKESTLDAPPEKLIDVIIVRKEPEPSLPSSSAKTASAKETPAPTAEKPIESPAKIPSLQPSDISEMQDELPLHEPKGGPES